MARDTDTGAILPAIHSGGDTAARLLEQQRRVLHAIRMLKDEITAAAPNQRNYHVLPNADAAWAAAVGQQEELLDTLARWEQRTMAVAMHCRTHLPSTG